MKHPQAVWNWGDTGSLDVIASVVKINRDLSMPGGQKHSFDIVVSSDNNNYLAWQCMVFHHSCLTYLGKVPIFVVHGDGAPLVPGYRILQEKGGIIQRLPTFKFAGKFEYVARNAWATLKGVKTSADNIVLCDPDMVFLRHVDFSEIAAGLAGKSISVDRIGFMTVGDHNRPILEEVCRYLWIDTKLLNGITIGGGVPYVIPTDLRRRLAREWAGRTEDCLMTSFEHHGQMNSEVWISLMWVFVLAALRLDIPMSTTDLCILNVRSGGERSHVLSERSIIHYAYGDEFFNKKNYMSEDASIHTVWKACAPEGTINGAVTGAIREAAVFYGLA